MEPLLPWIVALTVLVLALVAAVGWRLMRERKPQVKPLPTEWSLAPRPVFSTDERRVYRQLREALPHHIVLSKLPLVRFCQPNDPQDVRFWYELLGSIHVTFAICSANGRVLAAIDLDTDRGNSRRVLQIKQSVLGACRVRYLRCPVDHLPSVAELQLLVPQSAASSQSHASGSSGTNSAVHSPTGVSLATNAPPPSASASGGPASGGPASGVAQMGACTHTPAAHSSLVQSSPSDVQAKPSS